MKLRDDVWTFTSGLPVYFRGNRLHVVEFATKVAIALGAEEATSFAPRTGQGSLASRWETMFESSTA